MKDYKKLTSEQLAKKLQSEQDSLENEHAGGDVQDLVHELQVHQIELEMQNRELREAQQKLEETCGSYADLYDFAPIGYIGMDNRGVIREINLTAATMLGLERSNLLKQPMTRWIDRSNHSQFFNYLHSQFIENSESSTILTLTPHPGHALSVKLESVIAYSPSQDCDLCRTAFIDITELTNSQASIVEKENQLTLVIDAMPVLIAYIDKLLQYRFVNLLHEQWFKRKREKIIGAKVRSVTGPNNFSLIKPDLETALNGHHVKNAYRLSFPDQKTRDVEAEYIPHYDQRNELKGIIVLVSDRSEQKAVEQQNRQRQEEQARIARFFTLGEMATSIAHEINQPLSAISNYAHASLNLLRSESGYTQEVTRALEAISTQSNRAGEIIRSIRRFVKKGEPKLEPVDINEAIKNAVKFVEPESKHYHIPIKLELQSESCSAHCDRIQVEQVIINLVRNAMEAMADNVNRPKEITIRTETNDSIDIFVIDSGTGIPSNIMDNIFDPFISSKSDGMGFGLAISQSIATICGGEIKCTKNDEKGCIFKFSLPII